jgi:hypothetical protein
MHHSQRNQGACIPADGGLLVPFSRGVQVNFSAKPEKRHLAQPELSRRDALCGRKRVQTPGPRVVLIASATVATAIGEHRLRLGLSGIRRLAQPIQGALRVAVDSQPVGKDQFARFLRRARIVLRRRLQPESRAVRRDLLLYALQINEAKLKLRFQMSLGGRKPVACYRIGHAAQHAFAARVKQPHAIIRLRIAERSGFSESAQRLDKPALFIKSASSPAPVRASETGCQPKLVHQAPHQRPQRSRMASP